MKGKLRAEGWKQISEGVFERQRTDTQVERVGYGREGHIWLIGELKGKLNALREEYQRYPSEDLARIIDDLTLRIENAREELRSSSRQELSSLNEASAHFASSRSTSRFSRITRSATSIWRANSSL